MIHSSFRVCHTTLCAIQRQLCCSLNISKLFFDMPFVRLYWIVCLHVKALKPTNSNRMSCKMWKIVELWKSLKFSDNIFYYTFNGNFREKSTSKGFGKRIPWNRIINESISADYMRALAEIKLRNNKNTDGITTSLGLKLLSRKFILCLFSGKTEI